VCFFGAGTLAEMPTTFSRTPAATGDRVETTDAVQEFARAGAETVLATDDGSAGFAGTVTAALGAYLAGPGKGEPAALYGCGPTPMLKALGEVAREHGLACQVSLERFMACGVGVCLSCVTKRRDAGGGKGWTFRLTCREGPVVDSRDILWD